MFEYKTWECLEPKEESFTISTKHVTGQTTDFLL